MSIVCMAHVCSLNETPPWACESSFLRDIIINIIINVLLFWLSLTFYSMHFIPSSAGHSYRNKMLPPSRLVWVNVLRSDLQQVHCGFDSTERQVAIVVVRCKEHQTSRVTTAWGRRARWKSVDGKVFCFVFWQGGAVGEVWLISRKSKELPSLTNTNKNLHSWVKYIYGVCSSQNPDFRQSSFFFSTTELTKPTETSPHLQIQAVSDNPRHSIDQRMIMWPYDCIPQVHGKKTLQDINNRRLFTVSV